MEKRTLIIEFDGFKIGRVASVCVSDPVQAELLPSSPYQRTNVRGRYQDSQAMQTAMWVVPGRQLTRYISRLGTVKLCDYVVCRLFGFYKLESVIAVLLGLGRLSVKYLIMQRKAIFYRHLMYSYDVMMFYCVRCS